MSKIQDALRKIQSSQSGMASAEMDLVTAPNEDLATLHRNHRMQSDSGIVKVARIVIVDRKVLVQNGLLAPESQDRALADQYRLIKRPLLDNAFGIDAYTTKHMNLLMVASALPGDGKTFTCINLALSIAAEKDTSVLLVDADVAKPHISHIFKVDTEAGLIDLLTDKTISVSDTIIPTDIPGLSILPAGKATANATELLASRRMGWVADQLCQLQEDRIVIFDSAPILATSESHVLADHMGQIVMVVRAGHTPQQAVLEALESLDENKAVNLVLNQAVSGFGTYGYGDYGYGNRPEKD